MPVKSEFEIAKLSNNFSIITDISLTLFEFSDFPFFQESDQPGNIQIKTKKCFANISQQETHMTLINNNYAIK